MPLPAHLSKYDGLLDLLVEELVREVLEGSDKEKPAASCQTSPPVGDRDGDHTPDSHAHAT